MLLTFGCKQEEAFGLRFSHALHVNEQNLSCSECHAQQEGGLGRLEHANCIGCHQELIDAAEASADTCGVCHRKNDFESTRKEETIAAHPGAFRHTSQLADSCLECHQTILTKEAITKRPADRTQIRQKAHRLPLKCEACHIGMDPDTPPQNHTGSWKRTHGAPGSAADATCSVCHQEQSCSACHAVMQPSSHTQLWNRVHGIEGAWDRDRCMTCHREDSCMTCHREVQPRSHGGDWNRSHGRAAKSGSSDCLVCHQQQSCNACHRSTRPAGHTTAFIKGNHRTAAQAGTSDCLSCHQQQSCDACHRSSQPASHTAAFIQGSHRTAARAATSDCLSCHQQEFCNACHRSR